MSYERLIPVWEDREKGVLLHPKKQGASFSFDFEAKEDKNYHLFTVGNSTQYFAWKAESDAPMQYLLLDDSLDTEHAESTQYSLSLCSEKPEEYVRRAYKKVRFPKIYVHHHVTTKPVDWVTGISVCAKDLKIEEGGYLRMRVEARYRKNGVSPRDVITPADISVVIDFPEGSYPMTELMRALPAATENVANVCAFIEGYRYSGEVYVEEPKIILEDYNLLPDFTPAVPSKEDWLWIGQNFSKKEWHKFRISLNGEEIFYGDVFERCHRESDFEIELPSGLLKEHNTVCYELLSDYHDALPYRIFEISLCERNGGELALVSASRAAKCGGNAYILVRTQKDNAKVELTLPKEYLSAEKSSFVFDKAGLHGIPLACLKTGTRIPFSVSMDGVVRHGEIGRIAEGDDDGILTGTGDMIYVGQELHEFENYLCWYLSENVGNYITIRPIYHWGGAKYCRDESWKMFTRVMNECHMHYIIMPDGRDICGVPTNPPHALLRGEGYMGRQAHEVDGAVFYWPIKPLHQSAFAEHTADLYMFNYLDDNVHTRMRYNPSAYVTDVGACRFITRNPLQKRDMKVAATEGIKNLIRQHGDEVYHTGPSVLFKYFMQAGWKRVGAETMYNSMELIQSFLRGVADSYGFTPHGVHHALQWCSAPHDAPEHSRRYRLALYISYMQGATDINTEEGLWHMEENYARFNRFSDACREHLKQQQDFHKYLATHTRHGKFYTPMALVHGRYDGFVGFRRDFTWGWFPIDDYEKGNNTDAENSWDLMKVFYPQSRPGESIYRHPCPTDKPQGYYTSTPLGCVDTLPIEQAPFGEISYGALAFMGYNCYEKEDFDRLEAYVKNGGRLMLTMAHMTDTTLLSDIRAGRLNYCETAFSFTEGAPKMQNACVNGVEIPLCVNAKAGEVLARTDDGKALVSRYAYGKGEVILFHAGVYPSHAAICELYGKMLKDTMVELTSKEPSWVSCGEDMQFTVYDDGDTREIYLIAPDWYNAPDSLRHAEIRVGEYKYKVELPFGVMIKCVIKGDTLVYPHSEDGEVLSICGDEICVQGEGKVEFTVCKNGKWSTKSVDFSEQNTVTL
jgi:hypothetical protein